MDYAVARRYMVESQVRTNHVRNPQLIQAMAEVPREAFLPKAMRGYAYLDTDLHVGGDRWLMAPMTLAHLVEAAAIKATDVVLGIGDVTGYATAVIARLAGFVVALDCDADWVQKAAGTLADLGVDNADAVHGSLRRGHPAKAPYDVIVLFGAVGEIPAELCAQLAEGGRLVAVVGGRPALGRLELVVRAGDSFGRREILNVSLPSLPELAAKSRFEF